MESAVSAMNFGDTYLELSCAFLIMESRLPQLVSLGTGWGVRDSIFFPRFLSSGCFALLSAVVGQYSTQT